MFTSLVHGTLGTVYYINYAVLLFDRLVHSGNARNGTLISYDLISLNMAVVLFS